jgi:enediyne biosynthesis protein E4
MSTCRRVSGFAALPSPYPLPSAAFPLRGEGFHPNAHKTRVGGPGWGEGSAAPRLHAALAAALGLLCHALVGASGVAVTLRNVAQSAGVRFVLQHHPTPENHLIESVPGGVAAFDYDGDGRVDLFFTNGAASPTLDKPDEKYWNRLYRNDGGMTFTDVTREARVAGVGYGMGAAAADYDNDGDVDLFVAAVKQPQLYRNTGKGQFDEVARAAGLAHEEAMSEWPVGGGWFDYDNDGRLDLFVVNYVKWAAAFDRYCGDAARQVRVYCHPRYFEGLPNRLYRNRGDSTFEDVSVRSGIARHVGKGMSVAFADYDDDGFLDAFVTNDGVPNFLFRNRGDGGFDEVGLLAGVAVPAHGRPVSSMGTDFQDYDNDGRPDIHLTALAGETFPLYRNQGRRGFTEVTQASGLGSISAKLSGWSTIFADLNNDGWKDLFTANAHVNDRIEAFEASTYKQANTVFLNTGAGRFRDASAEAGPDFRIAAAHHGAAAADFNDDGRVDVVVSALGAPAELWENTSTPAGHWIILKLVGTRSNRDGIGARITIGSQTRIVSPSAGYVSSSDVRAHFGLGDMTTIDRMTIVWPSGTTQILERVAADRVVVVREGG